MRGVTDYRVAPAELLVSDFQEKKMFTLSVLNLTKLNIKAGSRSVETFK